MLTDAEVSAIGKQNTQLDTNIEVITVEQETVPAEGKEIATLLSRWCDVLVRENKEMQLKTRNSELKSELKLSLIDIMQSSNRIRVREV